MTAPILDWKELGPGRWATTVKVSSGPVDAWVRHWNGRSVKTPGGPGRIDSCSPDEANGTVDIVVRLKADL